MGENSGIEWTDHTFNPWIGCSKVSDGCKNCYAESLMDKRWGKAKWGDGGTRVRTSDSNWREPLRWDREAQASGRRARVFCASLADVFEDRQELKPWRDELFALIMMTPNLDWLLLTKRPENAHAYLTNPYKPGSCWDEWVKKYGITAREIRLREEVWPLQNVWLGTSVENQATADERIPHLLRCPAAVRFLSCEPLLGAVDLSRIYCNFGGSGGGAYVDALKWEFYSLGGGPFKCGGIDWVICGGESGPNARPFDPEWARSLRDQCKAARIPFFGKQWDKKRPLPDDLMIREFPDAQ